MKKLIYLLFFIIAFFGCNNDKSNVQKEAKLDKTKPKSLSIDFNFRTSEADEFRVMINNIEVDEFQKKNIQIIENVTKSTSDDNIVANFDANNLSKQVVIHLGSKTEKEVTINGVLISYGDKQFNLTSPQDFNSSLVFNKFIVRDSTSNVITTKRIDGKLNPTIRLKNSLINQLQRE